MSIFDKIRFHFMSREQVVNYYRKRGVNIGERCAINTTTNFSTEPYLITIGDDFFDSSGVNFVTHDGGVTVIDTLYNKDYDIYGKINIGNNVFIGMNAIILYNTEIGDNVIVAAGAVCKGKYPSNCVIGGVPAKVLCTLDEFHQKHRDWYVTGKNREERKNNYFKMLEDKNNESRL